MAESKISAIFFTMEDNMYMYIPRLRRISDVINEMKKADPESIITYYTIIKLIEVGKLTALKYGNAWLINLDELYCILGGKPYEENNVG